MENDWIELIGRNVPSSKNSKMWVGKRLIKNKLSQVYEKWAKSLLAQNKPLWDAQMNKVENYPIRVEFFFYRDSKRVWDFVNIVQILADLLQSEGYIENDCTKIFIPVYAGEELTKKDKSGVKFRIIA